ncbi:MAG: hypothetical protein LAO77_20345 [Acidobacteriia bacterium]|nr:hypothetical protein [Terriglobia bacterium]
MFDGRRIERVFGETMREIGILVIVFVPLDAAFAPNTLGPATLRRVVIGAAALIFGGIMAESRK